MDYEPEYGDLDDCDYEGDDFDFDDCPFGSGGYPQLGTEDCEFACSLSTLCRTIYDQRKDCVNPDRIDARGWVSIKIDCVFFHMGKCYIELSNYSPKPLQRIVWRLMCRFGMIPSISKRVHDSYRKKEAEK